MVLCGNGHPLLPTIRPSANKQLYILDNYMQLAPVGVIGELYIGGTGIARGYLNRPELTAEKFVPNDFGNVISPSLYKTGDLACYLPDGRIRLLGRIDNQVKIRGFRIEPQEVEAVLCQHPLSRAAVVIVREDQPGEKRLVAYVVPTSSVSVSELRKFMREKLPEYLVPTAFVLLEDLPLTPNGKVDVRSLPAPEQITTAEYVPPRTDVEAQLANIYAQILNLEKCSIHDDFFDLGGHSLLATQLIAQSLQVFQVELTVIDLFEAPTVALLSERIMRRQLTSEIPESSEFTDEEREEIEI
jgi:hypothetical protein